MHAAETFDADLYVVIATIVPIFMLATTVSAFRGLGLRRVVAWTVESNTDPRARRVAVMVILVMTPFVIAFYTEIAALDALAGRRNLNPVLNDTLLISVILLIAVNVIGILLQVLEGLLEEHYDRARS